MGTVELLFAEECINLLRRKYFLQPGLECREITDGPFRGLHLTTGSVTGHFPDAKMNVGMPFVVGDANNLLEGWM